VGQRGTAEGAWTQEQRSLRFQLCISEHSNFLKQNFFAFGGLNSGLHTCKTGALPLEPHLRAVLDWLSWRWGSQTICSGWPSAMIFPISASQVARITGVYLATGSEMQSRQVLVSVARSRPRHFSNSPWIEPNRLSLWTWLQLQRPKTWARVLFSSLF
jgi:hypothetical protein